MPNKRYDFARELEESYRRQQAGAARGGRNGYDSMGRNNQFAAARQAQAHADSVNLAKLKARLVREEREAKAKDKPKPKPKPKAPKGPKDYTPGELERLGELSPLLMQRYASQAASGGPMGVLGQIAGLPDTDPDVLLAQGEMLSGAKEYREGQQKEHLAEKKRKWEGRARVEARQANIASVELSREKRKKEAAELAAGRPLSDEDILSVRIKMQQEKLGKWPENPDWVIWKAQAAQGVATGPEPPATYYISNRWGKAPDAEAKDAEYAAQKVLLTSRSGVTGTDLLAPKMPPPPPPPPTKQELQAQDDDAFREEMTREQYQEIFNIANDPTDPDHRDAKALLRELSRPGAEAIRRGPWD